MSILLHTLALATICFLTLVFVFFIFYKYRFTYWKRKNIPQIKPSIPFGNIKDTMLLRRNIGEVMTDHYSYFKERNLKYGGLYVLMKPVLMITDPHLVKLILTKHFANFIDRDLVVDEENDPVSKNISSVSGVHWKILRAKFSPAFTSGKLKAMYEIFLECSKQLVQAMDIALEQNSKVDIKDLMARFTTDIICSSAFGLDCNTLKDSDGEIRKHGKLLFRNGFWDGIARITAMANENFLKLLKLRQFNAEATDFFTDTFKQMMEYREKNGIVRKDFMDMLIRLKNNQIVDDKVENNSKLSANSQNSVDNNEQTYTIKELAAHAISFLLAGFDTSSSTMAFCLCELAQNLEIQERLREEINEVAEENDGHFPYDVIMEMDYLNKVVKETLRKYPIGTSLSRKCVKRFEAPECGLVIEKDTNILIPVMGLQRDPEYYPDPLDFDPERFTDEEIAKRHPYTYLPFGEGPRNCIGLRFAMLQTKLGLATILQHYKFFVDSETIWPIKPDPEHNFYVVSYPMWLRVEKVSPLI